MSDLEKLGLSVWLGIALAILALWMGIIWGDDPALDKKLTETALVLFFLDFVGAVFWLTKP